MYHFRIQKSRVLDWIPLHLLPNELSKSRITFSKKTGIASTTTADDRGSASIMYVKARQAWFIWKTRRHFYSMRTQNLNLGYSKYTTYLQYRNYVPSAVMLSVKKDNKVLEATYILRGKPQKNGFFLYVNGNGKYRSRLLSCKNNIKIKPSTHTQEMIYIKDGMTHRLQSSLRNSAR